MLPKTTRVIALALVAAMLASGLMANPAGKVSTVAAQAMAQDFSLPLGYVDGGVYGPRTTYRDGQLIENSDYGVKNPDMQGSTCFGMDWGDIYHAGEDWYRLDGQSAKGAPVTAVADGIVKYLAFNFPGAVIIIEHSLPPDGQQKIYSVYGHLDPNSVVVQAADSVTRGQLLGAILEQWFDGRYTDYHDDSHLHFEMRYFYDATNIYSPSTTCNGYLPGRGYTYPEHPNDFPASLAEHYTDGRAFILPVNLFLPSIIGQLAPCSANQELLVNRGFEMGKMVWAELMQPGFPIITNEALPVPAYGGNWVAWFGGRHNATERIYQEFIARAGMTGANLGYYVWMGTDETDAGVYDTFFVRLREANDNLVQQLDYLDDNATEGAWLYRLATLPDLSARAGQTLRLSFEGTTDSNLITHFIVDDVSLVSQCNGAGSILGNQPVAAPDEGETPALRGSQPTKPFRPTAGRP